MLLDDVTTTTINTDQLTHIAELLHIIDKFLRSAGIPEHLAHHLHATGRPDAPAVCGAPDSPPKVLAEGAKGERNERLLTVRIISYNTSP